MNHQYLYSASLIKTLEKDLLSAEQLNRLLASETGQDIKNALTDTFIGHGLAENEEQTLTLAQVNELLEKAILEAKNILTNSAPEPEILGLIWLKYDLHNIRAFLTSRGLNLSDENTNKRWISPLGQYHPPLLLEACENASLKWIRPEWEIIDDLIKRPDQLNYQIDANIDLAYLLSVDKIAQIASPFIKEYTSTIIDFHNIINYLRHNTDQSISPPLAPSGSVSPEQLQQLTKEEALKLFYRFGGESTWKEAVEEYLETEQFTALTKNIDNYLIDWLIENSRKNVFSVATLLSYFNNKKNDARIIRSVVSGLLAGLDPQLIKNNLRKIRHA
ncbi:MAG: V-type ATPase subunit [Patescibacteria group bacterium]